MKHRTSRKITFIAFFVLLAAQAARPQSVDSSLVTVPDLLKDNVAFWKKVYTEISLDQGMLHDRDYPLVIYKVLDLPQRDAFSQSRYVESQRRAIVASLTNLQSQPESTWTQEEKDIARLMKDRAPQGALSGAQERVRLQMGQKERFKEGLQRSTAYIDTIRDIFVRYNVPADIAYLPHVESSFNTEAYSKVGAAGLWQFMRGTGRLYLKINYLIDERRDPVAATIAAAKLLRQSYDALQSWPLAITAYNHGLNGMKRAVEVVGSRDISDIIRDYSSPTFQFASKNFFACFLAASDISKNPVAYFGDLHCAPKQEFKAVTLPSFMRPAVVCKYLSISQKTLMEYNPALRPVVFFQQKQIPAGFTIRVPAQIKTPEAEKVLASVPDSLKSDTPERSQYYSVERGDNLIGIGSRLGVPVERLALENNITRNQRIYAGQVLRVPSAGAVPEGLAPARPLSESTTADRRRSAISDSLKEVATAKADTLPPAGFSKTGAPGGMTPAFDASVYNLATTVPPVGDVATITVTVDETMGHYAEWLGIPTGRIRQLNGMGARSEIRINGTLAIPADKDLLARFVKARLEYHMALEEDFYSRYKVTDVRPRTILRGEALWTICNEQDQIPLWLFAKYNKHLDLSTLMPGMRVWIPVIEEKTEQDIALESGQAMGIYPAFDEPAKKGASSAVRRMP